jgi:hypothetical protein
VQRSADGRVLNTRGDAAIEAKTISKKKKGVSQKETKKKKRNYLFDSQFLLEPIEPSDPNKTS